jgi:hypothetical protein
MRSELRSKMTRRLVPSAAVALLAAFAIAQDRTVALDAHGLDTASIFASTARVEGVNSLRPTRGSRTSNPWTHGSSIGKVKTLYALVTPQVLDPIICQGNVTQGGWGRTGEVPGPDPFPVSTGLVTPGKVTFGGSAQTTANNVRGGQEQFSDHNSADPFTFHSTLITDVMCFDNPVDNDGVHATIKGQGRVTKLATFQDVIVNFTLELDDRGEPGAGRDEYQISLIGLPFAYFSGPIILQGGNVQIRQ